MGRIRLLTDLLILEFGNWTWSMWVRIREEWMEEFPREMGSGRCMQLGM